LKKAFGVDRTHTERKIPGVYDVVDLGLNYRMSELHAALGIKQLAKICEFLKRRAENYELLSTAIAGVAGISLFTAAKEPLASSHYCLSILLAPELASKRPEIMAELGKNGIGTSVYYPHPVPRLSYYARKYGWLPGSFPNAERVADHSVALSVAPHLTADDMSYIADSVRLVVTEIRP
jgi:dTDP-4-amino-4,6-dideoxygalactose transaminase